MCMHVSVHELTGQTWESLVSVSASISATWISLDELVKLAQVALCDPECLSELKQV